MSNINIIISVWKEEHFPDFMVILYINFNHMLLNSIENKLNRNIT